MARGCGTGLAGQSVNAAVVFDFSKYMREFVGLDAAPGTARVQPGVVCDQLRGAARRHGLTFAVDSATHDRCTLGEMIGNNSCGTHSVRAAIPSTTCWSWMSSPVTAPRMVKDLLDESSSDASPAHAIPGPVGQAAVKIAGKLQGSDHTNH